MQRDVPKFSVRDAPAWASAGVALFPSQRRRLTTTLRERATEQERQRERERERERTRLELIKFHRSFIPPLEYADSTVEIATAIYATSF